MKMLGAVLAGGQSSRFGSDKAVALIDGLPLIDHVVMGLFRATDHLVIAGREWRDFEMVADGAYAGQGPLAGLLAALQLAKARGFDAVLSAACDALPVPDLLLLEGSGPAVFERHWLFGFWPVTVTPLLAAHLDEQSDRSVRLWLDRCNARRVAEPGPIHNLNTREDLAAYEQLLAAGQA